jgi:hypothetical protein
MGYELLASSNIKITPEDWALTPSSVQQALLQVLERLAALEEEVSRLRAETERLGEQTRRSSRNSSQPPSSDAPSAPPWKPRQSSGRKRGAQPGHEGHQRKLYPVEACRSVSDQRPTGCCVCGAALAGSLSFQNSRFHRTAGVARDAIGKLSMKDARIGDGLLGRLLKFGVGNAVSFALNNNVWLPLCVILINYNVCIAFRCPVRHFHFKPNSRGRVKAR